MHSSSIPATDLMVYSMVLVAHAVLSHVAGASILETENLRVFVSNSMSRRGSVNWLGQALMSKLSRLTFILQPKLLQLRRKIKVERFYPRVGCWLKNVRHNAGDPQREDPITLCITYTNRGTVKPCSCSRSPLPLLGEGRAHGAMTMLRLGIS